MPAIFLKTAPQATTTMMVVRVTEPRKTVFMVRAQLSSFVSFRGGPTKAASTLWILILLNRRCSVHILITLRSSAFLRDLSIVVSYHVHI